MTRSVGEARLLVEVEALPEVGPIDPDPRRAIVMSSVESIEVTVRSDRSRWLWAGLAAGFT